LNVLLQPDRLFTMPGRDPRALDHDPLEEYDLIHFEAMTPEDGHLEEQIRAAIARGELPPGLRVLVTPETVQEFVARRPSVRMPDLITTKTHSRLPPAFLAEGKRKGVVTRSAGYDHFEHLAGEAHVASLREYCVNAVAQTALGFLLDCANERNAYTGLTATFDRRSAPAFLELGPDRTVAVFGVGRIGSEIYRRIRAIGLRVVGVDVRADQLSAEYGPGFDFVSPVEAMRQADVVVNAMNLTRNAGSRFFNVGYFDETLFGLARDPIVFVNVTRGEIAPERVLLRLLRAGRIRGLGLDVFSNEDEFGRRRKGLQESQDPDVQAASTLVDMALARSGNVYVSPHQGFNSDKAARSKAVEATRHVVAWYRSRCEGFDEELPYY
jgi:D-lactate dehydrogenase